MQDICITKCPTLQTSDGQGGTTLIIDMIQRQGTFTDDYEMYQIPPDQLTIYYEEDKVIYDTSGLVSGRNKLDVSFSGMSSKMKVVLYAPLPDNLWTIYVSCPFLSRHDTIICKGRSNKGQIINIFLRNLS
jgi:hypothetical protein